jgi:hypothetical protein
LLDAGRGTLRDVPEEWFFDRTYETGWRGDYIVEAILEHAVMHVIRHAFQLEELLKGSGC